MPDCVLRRADGDVRRAVMRGAFQWGDSTGFHRMTFFLWSKEVKEREKEEQSGGGKREMAGAGEGEGRAAPRARPLPSRHGRAGGLVSLLGPAWAVSACRLTMQALSLHAAHVSCSLGAWTRVLQRSSLHHGDVFLLVFSPLCAAHRPYSAHRPTPGRIH